MQYPNRVIKPGEDDTSIVNAVRNRLNELGCGPIQETDNYGPRTIAAVKLFQSTHRDPVGNPLLIDGKVGSITWAALFGTENVPNSNGSPNQLLGEAVNVALSQVGVMEQPPGSNKGPEVNQYLACVDCPPGNFWCASFVFWSFNEAANKLNIENPLFKTAGCIDHWNKTKGKKILAKDALNNPALLKSGDIFIIDHGGGLGHTGILEKIEGGFIHTIEGNSNTGGSRNGIGVFQLVRKIVQINKGFIEY